MQTQTELRSESVEVIGNSSYVICAQGPWAGMRDPVYWSGTAWTPVRSEAVPYTLREGIVYLGDLNGRNARLPGMHLEPVHW